MRIYSIAPRDDVQLLDTDVSRGLEIMSTLGHGKRYEGAWMTPSVWRLKKPRKRTLEQLCDLTTIQSRASTPVISDRGKKLFEPLLGSSVQWLPLAFEEREYWLLNLLRIVDGLDQSQTKLSYFPDGAIRHIDEYAFNPTFISDEWMFKVPQSVARVLVTDRFRELIQQEGLTGFFFQPVWDSEHRPFRPTGRTKEIIGRPEIYGPEGFVPNIREEWPPEWFALEKEMRKKLAKR